MESAEKGEGGKKEGSDPVQDKGNTEGLHIIDEAQKSSECEENPDFGDGGGREETDLKPGQGSAETKAKKDDTDGDISKSVDSESRKSRGSGEGERDTTKENGEDETKTEETNNDEKNETEFSVKTEDRAKYEDQREEVTSHETGGEVQACRNPFNYRET
jgi:hypothetical protein